MVKHVKGSDENKKYGKQLEKQEFLAEARGRHLKTMAALEAARLKVKAGKSKEV
jgi:hypothetical protein